MIAPSRKGLRAVPLRWQGGTDFRSRGTVTQFVRDTLATHPDGVERDRLADMARRKGLPAPTRASFGGVVRRLRARGEIVEIDGLLRAARPHRPGPGA